ncbi:IS630 family transposase [Clostridium beijerinckii]|uniref:IS630 family transposase n=1 Tax=Clostridium beijerinckii TaxID=1520 RepID=UPI003D6B367A
MDILVINKITGHENEIKEIKDASKRTKSVRLYKRYSVLLKHFDGFNNRKIAEMENIDEHTVATYIKNYKANGLDGLNIAHGGGASKKINEKQEKIVLETITTKTPEDVGFESKMNWTIELVRQWVLKEFNIKMSHRGIAYVLHRLNLSYTRPTYVLEKADKEKQEKFKNDFEVLKKMLDGLVDTILFEDESMIRDYQAIQKNWFIKGHQRKIPTYGKNAGVKLIGILDYVTGKVYCEEHERYDAQVFQSFLNSVLKEYPKGKIVMILDNARIHHAKLIQPFLNEVKDRLELMFLSPYSPEFNLIEGLWGWLKSSVINNVFYPSLVRVRVAVQKFIKSINMVPTQTIDRLCVRM